MNDLLIGIFSGGFVSFFITYLVNEKQLRDLRRLHDKQIEVKQTLHDELVIMKQELHDEQLNNDRDIANLILKSMRYKEEHRNHPLPFIGKDMNLIIHDIHLCDHGHPDDTTHLFSWDNQQPEIEK